VPVILTRNTTITSDALNTLRMESWADMGPSDWDPVFSRSMGWVCAYKSERLVGFVNVAWDGGAHAFLLDTTVHRDFKRRGIGTELVREATALAREGGAEWLHVDYDETDAALEPFYCGCGFVSTPAGVIHLEPYVE